MHVLGLVHLRVILLYSYIIHIHLHICRCMQNHNDDTIKTNDTVLRKIYLSIYLKGLCVRESWRPNRTATYWPPLLWPSAFLSRSPGLLNRRPGSVASLGAGFLYRILSPTRLIPNSQSGAWGLPLLGAGFLYHILSPTATSQSGPEGSLCWVLAFSTASCLQLIEFPVHWVIW